MTSFPPYNVPLEEREEASDDERKVFTWVGPKKKLLIVDAFERALHNARQRWWQLVTWLLQADQTCHY